MFLEFLSTIGIPHGWPHILRCPTAHYPGTAQVFLGVAHFFFFFFFPFIRTNGATDVSAVWGPVARGRGEKNDTQGRALSAT